MKKDKLTVKTHLSYDDAVAYMEALLTSLKSGNIVVQSGEDYVTLTPGGEVGIEVSAKVKKGKQKFSFEIGWSDKAETSLSISDSLPAKKEKGEMVEAEPAEVPAEKEEAKAPSKTEDAPKAKPKAKAKAKPAARKQPAKKTAKTPAKGKTAAKK